MKKQTLVRNIAAVSLIEIMMIFAIIGVVTTACMGLSKPKAEYMKKIRIYTALAELEQVGKTIASEGHIDFTTDIGTCTQRYNNICMKYDETLGNISNQLPKIAFRAASTDGVVDPGLTTYSIYSGLTNAEKAQYKYLQNGLCQRMASVFKLQPTNINCATNITTSGLIDESSAYPTTFDSIAPQLYLNNGQVAYISKNLYNDFRASDGTITRKVICATSDCNSYNTIKLREAQIGSGQGMIGTMDATIANYSEVNNFINLPNETKIELLNSYKDALIKNNVYNTHTNEVPIVNYLQEILKRNKDYFIIYVDTDCKKSSENDRQCGNDTLNDDIFAFRMYRDGTVLPDFTSDFPDDKMPQAKMLKIRDSDGRFEMFEGYPAYANMPYLKARCYANLAGTYATGYAYDHVGICGDYGVIGSCLTPANDTKCKVLINKPSFLMR